MAELAIVRGVAVVGAIHLAFYDDRRASVAIGSRQMRGTGELRPGR